jgi:hypothetical protein
MSAPLSGWCLPPGQRHDSACRVCAMRQRDGLLPECGCLGHESDDETGAPV